MIDTLKLAIPISRGQQKKLLRLSSFTKIWRWVQFHPDEGLAVRRHPGILTTDGESHHRELRWDVTGTSEPRLYIEFSLPKFWQGHNIYLVYDWMEPLRHLKKLIEQQCHVRLPDVGKWELFRLDVSYAWAFPSQQDLDAYFENLRGLTFPYKRNPVWRKDSIFFPGSTYSAKLYKKLPEFKAHDRRALLKDGASMEWINHLEAIADGVLRFEGSFRRQWLQRRGILTVDDIAYRCDPVQDPAIQWDDSLLNWSEFVPEHSLWLILNAYSDGDDDFIDDFMDQMRSGQLTSLRDGEYFALKDSVSIWVESNHLSRELLHPVGGFHVTAYSVLISILQEMLTKFVGDGSMHSDNEVKKLLTDFYGVSDDEKKRSKAPRLLGFWLYVQRFGIDSAKETYGSSAFYRNKSDLKAAGVELVERPDNVTYLDDDFWRSFRMKAPSIHVVNKVDERGQGNILNLRKIS